MTAVDPSLTAHSIVRRSTTLDLQERLQARSAASAPRVHTSIGRTLLAPLRRAGFDYSCFRVFTYALQPTDADAGEPLPAGYRAAELAAADLQAAQFPELRDCAEYGGWDLSRRWRISLCPMRLVR
jgi:hypothetical protein